jgi:acyl-CoA synthetase (AMP-forming)/AMP-acid ligase II
MLELLKARAREGRPVAHFYESFERKESLSAADLLARARAFASGLPAPGRAGECILLSLPNTALFPTAFFGALLRGYVPVPLAVPELMRDRDYAELMGRVAKVTGARTLVSVGQGLLRVAGLPIPNLIDASRVSPGADFIEATPGPNDIAMIQFSSGSTGDPKGVLLTHAAISANLAQIRQGMRAGSSDVGCTWLPFYHDMGWIGGFLSPLEARYPIHVLSPFDFVASPYGWLKLASDLRATLVLGPDFGYRLSAKRVTPAQARSLSLGSVRLALSGAEPVNADTCRNFIERFKPAGFKAEAFFPVYGLAENALAVTFPEPGQPLKTRLHEGVEIVSCGKPLPGVELKVSSSGQIRLKSPSMTSGYYNDEKATRELFTDGWLETGDLGFLEGGELFIVGREKDVIIRNGRKFHPADLERRAVQLRGFKLGRLAVVSAREAAAGESIHLVAECREALPWRRSALRRELAARVSELLPIGVSEVHLVAPGFIPRTSSGKTRRFELKRRLERDGIPTDEKGQLVELARSRIESAYLICTAALKLARARLNRALAGFGVGLEKPLGDHLAKALGETLGGRIIINLETPFAEYHLDSLGLVRLHARITRDFGPIELHVLVPLRNLRELRDHLLKAHRHAVEEWRRTDGKSHADRDGARISPARGTRNLDEVADLPVEGHRLVSSDRPHQAVEPGGDRAHDLPPELREAERGATPPL